MKEVIFVSNPNTHRVPPSAIATPPARIARATDITEVHTHADPSPTTRVVGILIFTRKQLR